ncbi:peritrophin-1-like [Episyrphus balteatus]|uniref:peritrophin-1-like n=1 Tax=Episyrphus balteatus TaxID=286459 RepID=UPI0024861460|nr:peritrophin-1-like [Episyrphus balteatus]
MFKQTTSVLLVLVLINFTTGQDTQGRWYKSNGVANLNCPLDDDPDDPTLLPYQGDCTKFLKCSYGLAYTLSCPRNLHWSKTYNRCESPRIAQCNPNEVTAKPEIGGNGCTFAYAPHPTDCHKAIQCVDGKQSEIECPAGAGWDKNNNRCSFLLDNC